VSGFVIDASVALAWCFDDEATSAYDASYLELAMRRGLPFATKDVDLAKAAGRVGVSLLPTT